MRVLTALERQVIIAILTPLVVDEAVVAKIVGALAISERSFSTDVLDRERCVGFFSDFVDNETLGGFSDVPHHLGIQAGHNDLPIGGDFILFFDQKRAGIKMLEASFFGSTLPISEIISVGHGFRIQSTRKE
jgi:hypothetical protein